MKKETKFFLVILVVFILLNIFFLWPYYPMGDYALYGIVAKHISEGKNFPFFVYGQPYNGAATIFSYLLAFNFLIFGVNAFAYAITMLFLSSILLLLLYLFCTRYFNNQIALISSLLFVFPSTILLFLNTVYASYLVSLILNLIVVFVFYEIFYKKKKKKLYFIYLGLLFALSYYGLEFSIPVILICLLIWFLMERDFLKKPNFWIFLSSFIFGMIPLAIYNLTHNFENIKQLLAGTFIHKIACYFNLIPKTVYFGSKLVNHCDIFGRTRGKLNFSVLLLNSFPDFFGYVYYILFFVSLIFLIYLVFNRYSMKKNKINFRYLWLVFYILLYLALYALSGFSDTKHLLPLYPFAWILIGLFLYDIKKKYKYIFILLLFIIILSGFLNILNFPKDNEVMQVIDELNIKGIKYIYASYNTKWGIVFNSKENIIASCEGMCTCGCSGMDSRYPLYEELVRNSKEYNYLIPETMLDKERLQEGRRISKYYLFDNLGHEKVKDILVCDE